MADIHLFELIQSLSNSEKKVVSDYIQSVLFLSGTSENSSKQLDLFEKIYSLRDEKLETKDIAKTIGTQNLASLKYHLTDKIVDALLLSKNTDNENQFTEQERIIFSLKKKLLLVKVLYRTMNQKRIKTIDSLIDDIITISKKNEVYDTLIEALITQKYFKGIRLGEKEYIAINKEIAHYDYCNKALFEATDSYYNLVLNNEFIKSLTTKELDQMLSNSIKKIELDFKRTKSTQINYYLHFLHFAFEERKENYLKAIEYCNKLIELLKNNHVIFRKERMGYALDNLSHYKTYIGKYSEAAKYSKEAQKYYINGSFNYLTSKKQEFHAHFYNGNMKESNKCVEELLNHSTSDSGNFRNSKYIYYKACVLFREDKFKAALQLLNNSLEFEKDKTRWNLNFRIFNIMILIELKKFDEVSTQTEALRKQIERISKKEEVSKRIILISKTIRELEKENFAKINNKTQDDLLKLTTNKEYIWEHYTAELIPFCQWLKKKLENG